MMIMSEKAPAYLNNTYNSIVYILNANEIVKYEMSKIIPFSYEFVGWN